jgi:hypothetical protein
MQRIRKFLQLPRPEQLLLMRAFWALVRITLGLRTIPWRTLQGRLLKLANRRPRCAPTQRPSAQRIGWAVHVASRYVPKAGCLPQALAAQFLLTRYGYPVRLQIGIAKNEDGKFEAHAWVTYESGVIIGGVCDLERFVPLSPLKREDIEDYVRTA